MMQNQTLNSLTSRLPVKGNLKRAYVLSLIVVAVTAVAFGIMSIIGFTTKQDLTK